MNNKEIKNKKQKDLSLIFGSKCPVMIDNEITSIKVKRGRKDGILVEQIATPTTSGNCAPTLMASGYHNATYKNFYSLGHFPKMGILEIWESEETQEIPSLKDFVFKNKQEFEESPYYREDKNRDPYLLIPTDENSAENIKTTF